MWKWRDTTKEPTKTEDKNFYENSSNSNILDDFTDFIEKCFDNGYNNVDYNLSTKMFLMTLESNFMAQSSKVINILLKKVINNFSQLKNREWCSGTFSQKWILKKHH